MSSRASRRANGLLERAREREDVQLLAATSFALGVAVILSVLLFRPVRSGPLPLTNVTARPALLDMPYTGTPTPKAGELPSPAAAPASNSAK